MRLTVLGSADAFNSGGALHSGYLLEHRDGVLLLEAGPSVLAGLNRAAIDTGRVDAVLVSHYHGDHFAGLPFLFLEGRIANPRSRPLVLAGPRGLRARVTALYEAMYGAFDEAKLPFALEYIDCEDGMTFELAGFRVSAFIVPHPAEPFALGYRIQSEDGVLLFSGDSAWTERFVAHSVGVDLFLCECCALSDAGDAHTAYDELLAARSRLGCRRLLLTHLGADVRAAEDLALECAHDGLVVEVRSSR